MRVCMLLLETRSGPTMVPNWEKLDKWRNVVWQSTRGKWWLTHWASLLRWIWSISEYNLWKVSQDDQCKMWNGIVHHKSDRKTCVLPTADRNNMNMSFFNFRPISLGQCSGDISRIFPSSITYLILRASLPLRHKYNPILMLNRLIILRQPF